MQRFKFDPSRVHPAYRKAKPAPAWPVTLFLSLLCIFFGCIVVLTISRSARSETIDSANDPASGMVRKAVRAVQHFTRTIYVGNARTVASLSSFEKQMLRHLHTRKPLQHVATVHIARAHRLHIQQRPTIIAAVPQAHPVETVRLSVPHPKAPAITWPAAPPVQPVAAEITTAKVPQHVAAKVASLDLRTRQIPVIAATSAPARPDRVQAAQVPRNAPESDAAQIETTTITAPRGNVTTAFAPPRKISVASPVQPQAFIAAVSGMHGVSPHHNAGYVNYDVLASPQSLYGLLGYGRRIGSGVAEVDMLARAAGDDRGIMITGAAWQRHNDANGSTLTIGDAQSYRGKYEESVRFDGVQYVSPNFSYAFGWERTDFGTSPMHFGSLVTQVTASKPLTPRVTGEAHVFADSANALLGVGAIWNTRAAGQLRFGIAPTLGRGLTGYFGYAFSSPRMRVSIDERVWGAQLFEPGELAPSNFRQLRGTIDYNVSPSNAIRVSYGSQAQSGISTRTTTVGYVHRVNGAEIHVDLASTSSGRTHNAGLATYVSVPIGGGSTVTQQHSLQGGTSSDSTTFKHDLTDSETGNSYAVTFGHNGTSYTDATLASRTPASTTRIELSRYGGPLSWNAEFSGAFIFLDGARVAANQVIDQSNALDALKGRSSVTLTIMNQAGTPLPSGAIVRAIGESAQWRIGDDGRVDIDDIGAGPQTLVITLPSGECVIGIMIPPATGGEYDLGKQLCKPTDEDLLINTKPQ